MDRSAHAPAKELAAADSGISNLYNYLKKVVNTMKASSITGNESTAELMELRRSVIRSRRQQKAEKLFGISVKAAGTNDVILIPFPVPDFPMTA